MQSMRFSTTTKSDLPQEAHLSAENKNTKNEQEEF